MCSTGKLIATAVLGSAIFHGIAAIQTYRMENECDKEINMVSEMVYQGRITHRIQRSYKEDPHHLVSCESWIQSWDDHLMFYFEKFNLSCHMGYLSFLDGHPHIRLAVIPGLNEICGESVPAEVYTTSSRYLTVQYIAREAVDAGDAFSVIFTSYSTGKCPSYRHLCDNGRCISTDLLCTEFKSCGDVPSCPTGLHSATIAGIVIGSIICVCVIVTVVLLISICRRRQLNLPRSQASGTQQSKAVINPVYGHV